MGMADKDGVDIMVGRLALEKRLLNGLGNQLISIKTVLKKRIK
ncbi:MAG: hypothetical protein ACI9WC_000425 [Arenicella sp.]|jgi:hypothetical protein